MNKDELAKARRKILDYRENPVKMVVEEFKVEPDKWQRAALEAFASNDPKMRRIALRACAGPGKSAVLSWCGWNFLLCYGDKYDHPKAAAISITGDNLKDNLWAEFSNWQARSNVLTKAFKWTKERIFAVDHPETWFISARSFPQAADEEKQGRTLSGLHSRFVLYLIDESGDISPSVLKSAEQGLSTGNLIFGKIMQAGNPTSTDGMLYAACTQLAHLWFTIRITGDPTDSNRSPRIGLEWATQQIETYGRENPWVMAFILGEFPKSALNKLLGIDEVEKAMGKFIPEGAYATIRKRIGVDVARFGDDRSVLFPRQGLASFNPVEMRNMRSNEVAARVAVAIDKWKDDPQIFVDCTGGYGAGVADSLLQSGIVSHEVNFSGKAMDPRYFNKRSEMWFLMAEWVKRGGALPEDADLKRELTAPKYWFQDGKLRLEEKDQIKSRLKFSPDKGDSLALTFALPDMPAPHPILGFYPTPGGGGKTQSDWNPFDPSRA